LSSYYYSGTDGASVTKFDDSFGLYPNVDLSNASNFWSNSILPDAFNNYGLAAIVTD
jgi:hypothetical protein